MEAEGTAGPRMFLHEAWHPFAYTMRTMPSLQHGRSGAGVVQCFSRGVVSGCLVQVLAKLLPLSGRPGWGREEGGAGGDPRAWVPAHHMGDLDRIWGSWPEPGPAVPAEGNWGASQ